MKNHELFAGEGNVFENDQSLFEDNSLEEDDNSDVERRVSLIFAPFYSHFFLTHHTQHDFYIAI